MEETRERVMEKGSKCPEKVRGRHLEKIKRGKIKGRMDEQKHGKQELKDRWVDRQKDVER